MELKQTKIYVPTDAKTSLTLYSGTTFMTLKKEGNVEEKQLFTLTKGELERVIGDAFDAGNLEGREDVYCNIGRLSEHNTTSIDKEQYIKQILK